MILKDTREFHWISPALSGPDLPKVGMGRAAQERGAQLLRVDDGSGEHAVDLGTRPAYGE